MDDRATEVDIRCKQAHDVLKHSMGKNQDIRFGLKDFFWFIHCRTNQ